MQKKKHSCKAEGAETTFMNRAKKILHKKLPEKKNPASEKFLTPITFLMADPLIWLNQYQSVNIPKLCMSHK